MSSGGDGDRHREHLGYSQTKQAKKKKSRRPIDPEDIAGSISSAPERISHDTNLFAVPFGNASPTGTSPQLSAMRLGDSSSEQSDAMADYVYLGVEVQNGQGTTFERKASARLSSWIKSIRDSGERPGWMLPHVFDELGQYWNTNKFKAISDQAKMARGSLKGGSLHTGGAKTVGTIAREMEKELGRTPIEPEVFKKTHDRKKENESDPDVWVEERAERTFNDCHKYVAENLDSLIQLTPELSTQIWKEKVVRGTHKGRCYGLGSSNDVRCLQSGLEGIGSSRQVEALDGVQIAAMSDQIVELTAALAESERKRVAEQQSMSETV
ncbi:hypothetical protein MTR67_023269 [Solanum verrucosum]|uniref:Uncharacterized protein n=1 Tax=Solanum verrucosum TaxID=315347 RepID=A0AAF0R1J1_SOLVR|nr:hypothetical protein MTR67_023269 [Solanum verrucosum]